MRTVSMAVAVIGVLWSGSLAFPQRGNTELSLDRQLQQAIRRGTLVEVKRLLDAGANPNAKLSGGLLSPLRCAAEAGRIDVIPLLIDRGADLDFIGSDGGTPLAAAAQHRHPDALKLLLKAGAKPTGGALVLSMEFPERVPWLLDAGAPASEGMASAASTGRIDLVKLLLSRGATIDSQNAVGNTALHTVGGMPMVQFILDGGGNPNIQNDEGDTPLHQAVDHGDLQILKLFLDAGADPTQRNHELVSPTRLAAMRPNPVTYQLLVQASGGQEVFQPIDARFKLGKTIDQLIADIRSKDYSKRILAHLGLVAFGKEAASPLLEVFENDHPNGQAAMALMKLGPQASGILPQLDVLLEDEKTVKFALYVRRRLIPSFSIEELQPKQRNRIARALKKAYSEEGEK